MRAGSEQRAPCPGGDERRPFAALWVALGHHDKALTLLGKACANHEFMSDVKIAPELDPVRTDSRFHEVLRCANLE